MRQRYARHRRSRLRAFAQNLRLEFGAVTKPRDLPGVFYGVHLTSSVDTILAALLAEFKNGMVGRLRWSHMKSLILLKRSYDASFANILSPQ